MWVFKNKYFHIEVGGWIGWSRSFSSLVVGLNRGDDVDGQPALVYTLWKPAREAVKRRRRRRAIEFTICCDIFTIMGRRLHYIKYNKIRHKNNGVSRFKRLLTSALNSDTPCTVTPRDIIRLWLLVSEMKESNARNDSTICVLEQRRHDSLIFLIHPHSLSYCSSSHPKRMIMMMMMRMPMVTIVKSNPSLKCVCVILMFGPRVMVGFIVIGD